MSPIEIVTDSSPGQVDAAAQIRAEATAAPDIARLDVVRGMVADVLNGCANAMLLTALSPGIHLRCGKRERHYALALNPPDSRSI